MKIILCRLFFIFIRHARTRPDNCTDTRTAADKGGDGDANSAGKPAIIIALCHHDYVRIFRRNRISEGSGGMAAVNNIYIIMQKVCFWKITRPLLDEKQAVYAPQTGLFFYWNNGFFVLIGTKNIAHIAFIRRNALCRRALRLHTKTARFCGRMILISEYFSMRTSAWITL